MKYVLYKEPAISQMLITDSVNKPWAYLIELLPGNTNQDLDKCLSPHESGVGYKFDPAFAGTVCKVLGKAENCVRTIKQTDIHYSECLVECFAEGLPTHVIFGDSLPMYAELGEGKDMRLILPNSDSNVDKTGLGSLVRLPEFTITHGGHV